MNVWQITLMCIGCASAGAIAAVCAYDCVLAFTHDRKEDKTEALLDEIQALHIQLHGERAQAAIIRGILDVPHAPHMTTFDRTLDRCRNLVTSAVLCSKHTAAERTQT